MGSTQNKNGTHPDGCVPFGRPRQHRHLREHRPINTPQEVCELVPINMLVVLQTSDDDSRIDVDFACKLRYSVSRETSLRHETRKRRRRNQPIFCELICFRLLTVDTRAVEIDEDISAAV